MIISIPLSATSFSSSLLMPYFRLLITGSSILTISIVQGQSPSSSPLFLFTPTCNNMNDVCPDNAPRTECMEDPCADPYACPTGQGLTCHTNNCGGCNAICCIDPLFCPLDAMLCPDGITFVTRDHYDNCNFRPCEEEEAGNGLVCASDVRSCPDGETEVSRDPTNDCEYYSCGSKVDDEDNDSVVCATDIRQCSDSTYASRDPDTCCLFEPCANLGPIEAIMTRIQNQITCILGWIIYLRTQP